MAQASNWMTAFNHNHLRISRIIRCLRVLGLPEDARAFFSAVMEVHDDGGGIGDRSLMYWTRAMERPLYLAPDDEVDEGMGKDFLYEFEAQNNPGGTCSGAAPGGVSYINKLSSDCLLKAYSLQLKLCPRSETLTK